MRAFRAVSVGLLSALAWSCSDPDPMSTTGGGSGATSAGGQAGEGGTGATGATGATGGTTGNTTGGGGSGADGGGGSGGGTLPCDSGLVNVDDDGDGFSEAEGDCDDCNPGANPAAAEVEAPDGEPVDDDCDALVDGADPDLQPCDAGLLLDSADPIDAVKAIGFCDHAKFLTKATWVLADGLPPGPAVDQPKFHLGHGLHDHFGTNDTPREGERMLALSSGTARNTDDPGFVSRNFDKGYSSLPPLTFSGENAMCPGVAIATSSVQDAAGLELQVHPPSNATGFSFRFNYRTYDFPQYVCTPYTDAFWVNFVQGNVNQNVASDWLGNLVSASSALITQCDCPPAGAGECAPGPGGGGLSFDCMSVSLLEGTDFDGNTNPATFAGWSNGGTEWLVTKVPLSPNKDFQLRFVVFDAGVTAQGQKDHNVDSMVLIDAFRWHTDPLMQETVTE